MCCSCSLNCRTRRSTRPHEWRRVGTTVVLNPAPAVSSLTPFAGLVDYVVPNEAEATQLTGIAVDGEGMVQAVRAIQAETGARGIILTLGERGIAVIENGHPEFIESHRVHCVDSVGAGDAFCGGMAALLAGGATLLEAARYGNAAGALLRLPAPAPNRRCRDAPTWPGCSPIRRGDRHVVVEPPTTRLGKRMDMQYRRLGRSGLKVSVLSFGSWVTFGDQVDGNTAADCLAAAYESGVNFFDNAEGYAGGESERIMGQAIAKLGWARESFVVSTKLYWGLGGIPNVKNTLNRKYLLHAIDGSLDRFGLDFVDLLFLPPARSETPIEETVWAMHDIVSSGKALYWGTSEWRADEIRAAWEIAERHHLHKPVVEQPQYNLLHRKRVEQDYARLYEDFGLGLTTFSPLSSGLLTGKYASGIPDGSRASLPGYAWLQGMVTDARQGAKVEKLRVIADDLGCSLAQLAIAWCAHNPRVSTVITGASRVEQVEENLKALDVLARLDADVIARIDQATK